MQKKAAKRKPPHEWNKKELSLLGKISDGELAKRIGLPTHSVWLKRNSMGIPPSRPMFPVSWGSDEIALLGKLPDQEVAQRLDTSRKVVIEKRTSLGIPSYARTSKLWHTWTQKEIAMLGKRPDNEIAERLGIQPICVTAKRHRLGITGFTKRTTRNRPRRSIDGWAGDEITLLGKMTDKEVSERIGISASAVRLKRISLGIPPCGNGRPDGTWTPEVLARLGKEANAGIARDIGVSAERVRQKMVECGIAPFRSRKR